MKCIIPGANIKVFGRGVHCLSKIGEELYFEPLEHGLALRTVNSSRSAYACFLYAPSFFTHYVDQPPQAGNGDSEEVLKCKVGIKSCLTVFKSLSTLEKTVEKCKITLNMEEARLIFQLYCRHGIVKTYNLAFIECETLQAIYNKDLSPNVLTAQTRLLCDTVLNFQTTQEEVSLLINPQHVTFKNYTDDEPDQKKVIHTQMDLAPEEFENYQVGIDTEITFCLKELRAILGFSEPNNLPISMHFEGPGKPVVFTIDSDPSFEGHFVLATLADPGSQSTQQSTQRNSYTFSDNNSRGRPINGTRVEKRRHSPVDNTRPHTSSAQTKPDKRPRRAAAEKMSAALQDMMDDDDDNDMVEAVNQSTLVIDQHSHLNPNIQENDRIPTILLAEKDSESPVIPFQGLRSLAPATGDVSGCLQQQSDEEAEDMVPGTPPAKAKFKSLFFGLSASQASVDESQRPTSQSSACKQPVVLAADTDDEDD